MKRGLNVRSGTSCTKLSHHESALQAGIQGVKNRDRPGRASILLIAPHGLVVVPR